MVVELILGVQCVVWMWELFFFDCVVYLVNENLQCLWEYLDFWDIWKVSLQGVLVICFDFVFGVEFYNVDFVQVFGVCFVVVDYGCIVVFVIVIDICVDLFGYW